LIKVNKEDLWKFQLMKETEVRSQPTLGSMRNSFNRLDKKQFWKQALRIFLLQYQVRGVAI
jgi:hypothetical protein